MMSTASAQVLGSANPQDALDRWYFRGTNAVGVRYCGGMFVGLGRNGTIITSPDGKSWTVRNSGTTADLRGVTYGFIFYPGFPSGLEFLVVGTGGTILASPDTTNWTRIAITNTCDLNDVVCWDGEFIAAATHYSANDPNLLVSWDGYHWTPVTFPYPANSPLDGPGYTTEALAFCADYAVAAGGPCCADDIWQSPDGYNWTYVGNSDQVVGEIAYGNSRFLMVGFEGMPRESTNSGSGWFVTGSSVIDPGAYQQPNFRLPFIAGDLVFGNGYFVTGTTFFQTGLLVTDGTTWSAPRIALAGLDLGSIAYGNHTFVVAGSDGIYQSEPVFTPFIQTAFQPGSNSLNVRISGETGRAYRLQVSSDLVSWSDRWRFTNTAPTTDYFESVDPSRPPLFYRVVSP